MNRERVDQRITMYFESWVEKDFNKFISVIHDNAIVRECTGAVIEGKEALQQWFTEWNENGNKVVYWTIHSIGFDSEKISAFVEWKFRCIFDQKEYEWDGASIVYFRDNLIIEMNEYEMKQDKFFPYE